MSLISILLLSFWVGFSGAAMPGPMLALVVTQSQKRGFKAGPLAVLGHGLLELVLFLLLAIGLGELFKAPWFIGSVGLVGGAALVWMGTASLLCARRSQGEATDSGGRAGFVNMNPVVGGAVVSLSNPFWTLWWATIGLSLMARSSQYGSWGLVLFFLGHIGSDLVWFSFVSGASNAAKKLMAGGGFRIFTVICGAALVAFGVYFGFWGALTLISSAA